MVATDVASRGIGMIASTLPPLLSFLAVHGSLPLILCDFDASLLALRSLRIFAMRKVSRLFYGPLSQSFLK